VVKVLLAAGADTGLRNDNRSNAADIATNLRREQISRLLADRD
jgi:ankyrin repeat protein